MQIRAAAQVLGRHHSASTLPSLALKILAMADNGAQTKGWKCEKCKRQNKLSADYCGKCGSSWWEATKWYSSTSSTYSAATNPPWQQNLPQWGQPYPAEQRPETPKRRRPPSRQRSRDKGKGSNGGKGKAKGKGKHEDPSALDPAWAVPVLPTPPALPQLISNPRRPWRRQQVGQSHSRCCATGGYCFASSRARAVDQSGGWQWPAPHQVTASPLLRFISPILLAASSFLQLMACPSPRLSSLTDCYFPHITVSCLISGLLVSMLLLLLCRMEVWCYRHFMQSVKRCSRPFRL